MSKSKSGISARKNAPGQYDTVLSDIAFLLEQARRASARTVNSIMTVTYWEIGRRIVEYEQGGAIRAGYGKGLLKQLANDLVTRFGRGFSERNLELMRLFYPSWPISQTASAKFPLSWSHYVRLTTVKNIEARAFY